VWGNVVPVGYLQAIRERHVGHGSIALKGGALGSVWKRSGAILHLISSPLTMMGAFATAAAGFIGSWRDDPGSVSATAPAATAP